MSELYKAIAGSPITYLSSDISASQTTISIADDSALPDAPNICTIGYGENIETIRYGTKSNGVLQNVTRGIEGTPRAWSAGTEVARFFTAYDHNAIINTLVAHQAKNVSKAVLVIEPYDQLTQTTVNLGFRPKTLIIEAAIINTKYSSVGYCDENLVNLVKFTYAKTGNVTISGSQSIVFDYDGSGNRYIKGAVTYTESGILITWSKSSDALVDASGNRRLIIFAMTHGEG